ncbi:MAG: hypothetical protein COS57_05165 [Syntrophobacterales bacterium CG03_land_8_20_14_0_80_58_14]|nr:MAG: hypothetical protein COS57_05165 [Syntrophobacterales bacterium CG03_land_8_20_14_0_80_58_14]
MELDKFIAQSLTQILQGLREANQTEIMTKENPTEASKPFLLKHGSAKAIGSGIEFDIAVTTKKEGDGSGKAKIKLWVIEADLGGAGSVSKEAVSRIKFTVYVNQWRG